MSNKGNYSDIQKMDRAGIIKKIIVIAVILVLLFIVIVVIKALSSSKGDDASVNTKTTELSMVPTNINYYDPREEKTYDVGTNYIILSDGQGYLKVSSDGTVQRVSSDGTYLKDATEEEKESAIRTAFNISSSDNQASMALDGLQPITKEESPVEPTREENLYKSVETLGYNKDDFIRQVYSTGSTISDVITLIDTGADKNALIKSIMANPPQNETKGEKSSEKTGISVNVDRIGEIAQTSKPTTTTTTSSENKSSYPSWLEESNANADMSALITTLQSVASSSSGTQEVSSWEKTNKQSEKSSWLSSQQTTELSASRLTRYDLVAGTTVPITIVTGVNTDLPGNVIGLVRQDVYDTLTGTNILIPKGSRLIATYNNSVSFGQKSVQIAWTQLITTDGYQFTLPGFNGTTPDGYTGVSDKYSNHFWSMLGGAVFGSFLDWTSVYAQTKTGDLFGGSELSSLFQALTGSTISTTATVGQKYADLWLNLQPTIKIRTGSQTQLLVNQTISLKRASTSSSYGF